MSLENEITELRENCNNILNKLDEIASYCEVEEAELSISEESIDNEYDRLYKQLNITEVDEIFIGLAL